MLQLGQMMESSVKGPDPGPQPEAQSATARSVRLPGLLDSYSPHARI